MKSKKKEIPEWEYFFSWREDNMWEYEKMRFESYRVIHDTLSPYRQ